MDKAENPAFKLTNDGKVVAETRYPLKVFVRLQPSIGSLPSNSIGGFLWASA